MASACKNVGNFNSKPSIHLTCIFGVLSDSKITLEQINHFASICNQLPGLDNTQLPRMYAYLPSESPPIIYRYQVLRVLNRLNSSKAGHPSDLPVKLIKEFSVEIANPL